MLLEEAVENVIRAAIQRRIAVNFYQLPTIYFFNIDLSAQLSIW